MENKNTARYDVLVAGGGFAGVYTAKALARHLRGGEKLGLISEENYMVFQPLLAEVVGSSISPRHVANPLRLLCPGVDVICGAVCEIDWKKRRLELDTGSFTRSYGVGYKRLVLALGSVVDLSRAPGMPEHAYLMKNVGDALELRSTIVGRMEEANLVEDPEKVKRLLTFVVVGGGYSGVETAGQILDLLTGIHRYYRRVNERGFRVVLVHSGEHLLPELDEKLGRYCEEKLRARGLELILEQRVTAMTASKVQLGNGATIPTYTVVSTVGNAPHPLILDLCRDNGFESVKGRIATDEFLRVKGTEDLWAVGDCAGIPMPEEGICPATAQFAIRQGDLAGRNIARAVTGKPLKPFHYAGVGSLASIGHRRAVAQVFGFRFSGFLAWFIWRTIYLGKLPGLDRKLRVVLDWTLDLFFPRDISLLQPRPSKVMQEMHFQAGDEVFRAGEPALSFYIVKSGRVEIREEDRVMRVLGPGEHFGERTLLTDGAWKFNSRATEPSILVAVNSEFFRTLSRASSSIRALMRKSGMQYLPRTQIQSFVEKLPENLKGMRAEDIMRKEVVMMRPGMKVREALFLMRDHPFNSFPLTTEDMEPLGMVHQEALLEALQRGRVTPDSQLDEFTPDPAHSVKRGSLLLEAVEVMFRTSSRKILVLSEAGRIEGMISLMDLLAPAAQPELYGPEPSTRQEPY